MVRHKPFTAQLIVIVGFIIFIYIFFALATSVYRDYKLELNIRQFESEIDELAVLARQKPEDVSYYQSDEYKDKYAKENLNLINPGEKVIIIPQEDKIVKLRPLLTRRTPDEVLKLPIYRQWWEYFFGQTLSVQVPSKLPTSPVPSAEELF